MKENSIQKKITTGTSNVFGDGKGGCSAVGAVWSQRAGGGT